MTTFLTILLVLAMGAVLVTLGLGMVGMVRGGEDAGRSNALMRWRVVLQGVTLVLFALLLLVTRH